LTTHYIEEAEAMADRVGVINKGELILIEEKNELMKKMGKKELYLELQNPLYEIPRDLADYSLRLADQGRRLIFNYDTKKESNDVADLLDKLKENGIKCRDIDTKKSSLEEIFVQ